MLFVINKPNPIPLLKVEPVANFENKFGKILEGIPMPVSFTFTITSPPLSVFFSSVVIYMVPSFVNLMALLSRFKITSWILTLSAFIKTPFASFPSISNNNFTALLL